MVTRARASVFKPHPRYASVATVVEPPPVPPSICAALRDDGWYQAMKDEHDALLLNKTWCLIPCPPASVLSLASGFSRTSFIQTAPSSGAKPAGYFVATFSGLALILIRRSHPLSSPPPSALC
jgi:hypothetical protein